MSENTPTPDPASAPDLLMRTHDVVSQLSKNFYKIGASLASLPECGAAKGIQELQEVTAALRGVIARLDAPTPTPTDTAAAQAAEAVLDNIRGELAGFRALMDRLCTPPTPPSAQLSLNDSDLLRLAGAVADIVKDRLPTEAPTTTDTTAQAAETVLNDIRGELAGFRALMDRLCTPPTPPAPEPFTFKLEDARTVADLVAGHLKDTLPPPSPSAALPSPDTLLKELQEVRNSIENTLRAHLPKAGDSEVPSVEETIRAAQKVLIGKMDVIEHKVDHVAETRPGSTEAPLASSSRLSDELDKRLAAMEKNLGERLTSVSSYRRRLVLAGVLGLAVGSAIGPIITSVTGSQTRSATVKIETLLQQWTQATAEASRSLERRTGEMTQLLGQKVDGVADTVRDISVRLDTLQSPAPQNPEVFKPTPPPVTPPAPDTKEKLNPDADNELPNP